MCRIILVLIVASIFTGAIVVWAQIGLEAMEQIENLPYFKLGTQAHQHAKWGPLYIDSNGEHVLAEVEGPGCVYNFWFTAEQNPPTSIGNLKIYIDGETTPRSDMFIEDYFSGENYPFVKPLVDGRFDRNGRKGGYSFFVPICFRESIKMTVDKATDEAHMAYHVIYHTFTTADGVESWTGTEDVSKIKEMWNNLGTDPKDTGSNLIISNNALINSGQTYTLANITGAGVINSIKIDPSSGEENILFNLKIRAYWDGESVPSIDVPLNHFFGSGYEELDFSSLMIGMRPDGYYSYFPMPYWESANLEIYNGNSNVISLDYEVQYATTVYQQDRAGHFHAKYNRENPTTTRRNYTVLNTEGRGHYVGMIYTVYSSESAVSPDLYSWMEGDEVVYIDDKKSPFWGTGSEDYFLRGWGFQYGTFPLFGVPSNEYYWNPTAYRIHIGDCIPFESNTNFGMEHGESNYTNGDYASVTFYYHTDQKNIELSDTFNVGNSTSEANHSYQINGEVWSGSLTSKYRGEDDTIIFDITDDGRSFNDYSEFTVSINPSNKGIRLRRRIDQKVGQQKAKVYVDGTFVKTWYTPNTTIDYFEYEGEGERRWRDIDFEIPESYTSGKNKINVKIEYVSSSSDNINEFYYWVYCYLSGKEADIIPPNPPNNITCSSKTDHSITLLWEPPNPASDGDTASSYIVKRNDETVGTTTDIDYEDTGLQESTSYNYAVFSVDDAGNPSETAAIGTFSTTASSTPPDTTPSSFGIHTSCMQIMPGDNNSPEPPGDGGDVDEIIRLHKEMGFKWDRCNIAWGSVEYPKGVYHWEEIDERLNKIFTAGIQASIIIYGGNNYDGTIYWDRHIPGFDGLAGTREEYKEFIKKCVERYDSDGIDDGPVTGSVKYWEAWNEPTNFAGISIEQATELFNDYYESCKASDPDCKVISPGFAWDYLFEYFIPNAVDFDMLSVHSNYWRFDTPDPDERMYYRINGQDSDFKNWGLGARPWWISEFGPDGACRGDHHNYSFRTTRMYVVLCYAMFHTNLICSGNYYCEGRNTAVMDWDNWTLKPCGVATKVYLSILQGTQIIQSERITGPDYRIYKFTCNDSLRKFALWALEEEGTNPQVSVDINTSKIRRTDLYGENVDTLSVSGGKVTVTLYPEPIYLEEISDDTIPPNPPKNLTSPSQTETSITLSWDSPDPASDGDTASSYIVKQNGKTVVTTTDIAYEDTGLQESAPYNYSVYSVDDGGNASETAATGTFTTKGDTTPPNVVSVMAKSAITVQVVYDEKVEQSSAESTSNYTIDNGITVQGVNLQSDNRTVILTTTELQEGITYQITITGVKDQSQAQNEITTPVVRNFEYVAELEITNISVATGKNYVSAYLNEGDEFYIDRTLTIADIPADYEGLLWIKTANDDKQENSPSNFLTYDVNQNVTVCVGYDTRLTLPGWLSGWTDTGDVIKSDAEEGKNTYKLYSKDFSTGTVTLGPNESGTSSSNMYIILNKGQAGGPPQDTTPPSPPTGVKVMPLGGN